MLDKRTDRVMLWFALIVGIVSGVGGYFIWHHPVPSLLGGFTMFLLVLVIYHYAGWGLKWRGMVFGIYGPEEEDEEYYDYVEKHIDSSQRGKK
ncbi:MAG: hypothetical protein QXJ27_06490 [Thermoplasmata archaeon]